jgi:glycine cleavage system aminomethyltransferase T
MIGLATSGCCGHHVKKGLAIGYLPGKFAEVGMRLSSLILGETKQATVLRESPHGPDYLELRA